MGIQGLGGCQQRRQVCSHRVQGRRVRSRDLLLCYLLRSGFCSRTMDQGNINITHLPVPTQPVPQFPDSYSDHRSQQTPLIIDNGSTNLRFGFASSSSPRVGINAISKYKERRTNKPLLLFGDGIDGEPGAKNQAKTPWEGDVLLNFDALVRACSSKFIGGSCLT